MTIAPKPFDVKFEPVATKDGIRVNIVNFVRWEDILSARICYHGGYPYISIKNKKSWFGVEWKIPLFIGNHSAFRKDVLEFSPAEHPFRKAILEFTGDTNEFRRKYKANITKAVWLNFILKFLLILIIVLGVGFSFLRIKYGFFK